MESGRIGVGRVNPRRDMGLITSVVGAVVLALSLFAPWYSLAGVSSPSADGWDAFTTMDLLIAACAFLGGSLAVALIRGAADHAMTPVVHVIGIAAVALVVYGMAAQPEPAQLFELRWGALLALGGAALLAVGPAVPGWIRRLL